jgi:hypothetical protein
MTKVNANRKKMAGSLVVGLASTGLMHWLAALKHRRHLTGLITAALDIGEYDRSLDALKEVLSPLSSSFLHLDLLYSKSKSVGKM